MGPITMNSAAEKKFFEVNEANQRLPLVRAIVEDIVQLAREVHERRERLARVRQLPGSPARDDESLHGEELRQVEDDLNKDVDRINEFVQELQELGAELKDPLTGLVDFPAMIDGREVYLCWKLGEAEIEYWHELDAGFQGRQPLGESLLTGEDNADDETN